jgi:hypothetical protein
MGSLVICAVLLSLVSCAPTPVGDFRGVPADGIPDGSAVVYVYRPRQVVGGQGCNMQLGEELIGALSPGSYTHRFLQPGRTRFTTVGDPGAGVTVILDAGEEVFIRQRWVFGAAGLEPRLDHMTRVKAMPELQRCTFVESPEVLEEPDDEEGESEEQP